MVVETNPVSRCFINGNVLKIAGVHLTITYLWCGFDLDPAMKATHARVVYYAL